MKNSVSVVIPVYNAESFIEKAVLSALEQEETHEVILIEDGSKDNSLNVCKWLSKKYTTVKCFIHTGNQNKGAGHSRNLGIENAVGEYIAFLDADDFFLPDRFRAEREIFKECDDVDGVYGALGFHFYTKEGEQKFREKGFQTLTTLSNKVAPRDLFLVLMGLHPAVGGYFSVDTLTIKRSVFFGKTEMFNNLVMHEDTVFFIQLSLNCNLMPGVIDEPIGLRGVHDNNRIVRNPPKSGSLVAMWQYLYEWSRTSSSGKAYSKLFEAFLYREKILLSNRLPGFFSFGFYILVNSIFFRKNVLFNPCCTYIFGKNVGSRLILIKERVVGKFFKNMSKEIYFIS